METSLYQMRFKDGRVYRIFCANRKQNVDMLRFINENKDQIVMREIAARGIHTMPQFKKAFAWQK